MTNIYLVMTITYQVRHAYSTLEDAEANLHDDDSIIIVQFN